LTGREVFFRPVILKPEGLKDLIRSPAASLLKDEWLKNTPAAQILIVLAGIIKLGAK